jgi:hypothetical protein
MAGAAGRSPFEVFLNTPGMTTNDPEYQALVAAAPRRPAPSRKVQTSHGPQWKSNPMDEPQPDDDIDDAMLLEAELTDLAQELTTYFAAQPDQAITTCTLAGPEVLTCCRVNGTYHKVSHVGGEDFKPVEAYIGKRKRMLIKFQPLQAAEYAHMEMFVDDALAHMHGFDQLTWFEDGSTLSDKLHALARKASEIKEKERNRSKFDDYDNFGMF